MFNKIVSISDANRNFSKVVKQAQQLGAVYIFKHNKPAFLIIDISDMNEEMLQELDSIQIKHLSSKVAKEYKQAYQKLSK